MSTPEPIVEFENVTKHFPVKPGGLLARIAPAFTPWKT